MWTGYYWTYDNSHVVEATIYTPENSYAMKYAKENGIRYSVLRDTKAGKSITEAKISGIKTSYVYNGKAQKPPVKVKLVNKTLKKGINYTVTYANNKKAGKATVKIKGIKDYSGTVTKTFKIVPKKASISKLTTPKSKTVKIIWKRDSQADGYQIQYAGNSRFTKGKQNIHVKKKTIVSKRSQSSKERSDTIFVSAHIRQ